MKFDEKSSIFVQLAAFDRPVPLQSQELHNGSATAVGTLKTQPSPSPDSHSSNNHHLVNII
jgi:hypothetical protein